MDGKTKRLGKMLFSLRSEDRDYTRAKEWVETLKEAVSRDPGLIFELKIVNGELERKLREVALKRGRQLLESLRGQTGRIPETYLRADVREIQDMIEKGILTYGELGIKHAELQRLGHVSQN